MFFWLALHGAVDTKEFTANFLLDSSTYTGLFSSVKPAKTFAQDPESTEY